VHGWKFPLPSECAGRCGAGSLSQASRYFCLSAWVWCVELLLHDVTKTFAGTSNERSECTARRKVATHSTPAAARIKHDSVT